MNILPAILEKEFDEIKEKVTLVKDYCRLVQLDVCDGKFVPSKTWPFTGDFQKFDDLRNEKESLPFWQDIDYEIDLMVNDPENIIDDWIRAGANSIIVHMESTLRLSEIIHEWKQVVEIIPAIDYPWEIEKLRTFAHEVNSVQVMGIEKIGFQGQTFNAGVLDVIKAIHSEFPNLKISVDGGINLETATAVKEAGADSVAVGSLVFKSENIKNTISDFQSI